MTRRIFPSLNIFFFLPTKNENLQSIQKKIVQAPVASVMRYENIKVNKLVKEKRWKKKTKTIFRCIFCAKKLLHSMQCDAAAASEGKK